MKLNADKDLNYFTSTRLIKSPKIIQSLSYGFLYFFAVLFLSLVIIPWWQTSAGQGRIISFVPEERIQEIHSLVSGRVDKWYIEEGDQVKEGQEIVRIIDNDPFLLDRLEIERNAAQQKYEAAKKAAETGELNFKRQKQLFLQGISSRLDYEKAEIELKKLEASLAAARSSLASAETKAARQDFQFVKAPKDGFISRILTGAGSVRVKEGDPLVILVPDAKDIGAEIFVDGNDLPLIFKGRSARLQFEGWPALQFNGWPDLAAGTFDARVVAVDSIANDKGQFRVLLKPDPLDSWQNIDRLRQGTRVKGWVILERVQLGYELWRRFNGFPAERTISEKDRSLGQKPVKAKGGK